MENLNGMSIGEFYGNLPRGKKDGFAIEVAEAIEKSVSTVQKKMVGRGFSKLEEEAVRRIIKRKEAQV